MTVDPRGNVINYKNVPLTHSVHIAYGFMYKDKVHK